MPLKYFGKKTINSLNVLKHKHLKLFSKIQKVCKLTYKIVIFYDKESLNVKKEIVKHQGIKKKIKNIEKRMLKFNNLKNWKDLHK